MQNTISSELTSPTPPGEFNSNALICVALDFGTITNATGANQRNKQFRPPYRCKVMAVSTFVTSASGTKFVEVRPSPSFTPSLQVTPSDPANSTDIAIVTDDTSAPFTNGGTVGEALQVRCVFPFGAGALNDLVVFVWLQKY